MRVMLILKGVIACRAYGGIQRQVDRLATELVCLSAQAERFTRSGARRPIPNAAQPIRRTSTLRVLYGEALP
jgi:hypothetical protein